jgi:hypothetical protein
MTPASEMHDGVLVVRDDLFPGGTKARYLADLFAKPGVDELVYASPAEGGAQTALAHCARDVGKRATIFVAKRAEPHPRAFMAKALGATVVQVSPGYLTVVQARARDYCAETGASLVPFGADTPEAIERIASAARSLDVDPAEVWCAAGSGVLARGLALAWPKARRHVVQVGRKLAPEDVAGATIWEHKLEFGQRAKSTPPFPSDPHYDAKAWEICREHASRLDLAVFWNVTGPA